MSLFEYVTRMEELRSPMAYVGVALLALTVLYFGMKMLFGMSRGMWRQLVSTGCTLTAAVASFLFSKNLATAIIEKLDAEYVNQLIPSLESAIPGSGEAIESLFSSFGSDLFSKILAIPTAIILVPFFMVTIFIVLHLLLKLIKAILVAVLRLKKADGSPSRLGGALLALLEALIVVAMLSVPMSGILGMVDTAYCEAMEQVDSEDQSTMEEIYDTVITPITKNPIIGLANNLGSEKMYRQIAVVKQNDTKIDVAEEVMDIAHLVIVEAPVLADTDFMNLTEEDKAAIDSVANGICESEYLSSIFVSLLNGAADAIESGVININMGGAYESLFNDVLDFLSTISAGTLESDLKTVKDLYYTVSDSGVLSAVKGGGDIMELLQDRRKEGDDTVKKIVAILQSNNRTAGMVTSMTEALISTLSNNIQLGDDVSVTYDELKSDMNNLLSVKKDNYETEEEYMDALSGTLDDTLRNHGIELEKDIVDEIASYVDKEYSDKEEFTDEEFNDVLLYYYDAYLNYLEDGEIPGDIIGGGDNNDSGDDKENAPVSGNKVGNLCIDLELELIYGSGVVSVNDYVGKTVIINFWGVWCHFCKEELPDFNRIADEYDGEVVVLTIHSTEGKGDAPAYIAEHFPDSKMIFAYDSPLMESIDIYYNILGGRGDYPMTLVLDENGVITFKASSVLTYDDIVYEIEAINNK